MSETITTAELDKLERLHDRAPQKLRRDINHGVVVDYKGGVPLHAGHSRLIVALVNRAPALIAAARERDQLRATLDAVAGALREVFPPSRSLDVLLAALEGSDDR